MTMTIGPHQHAWSHSTGRCVHCEISRTVFAPTDAPPVPPRVLVDLDDLEWLLEVGWRASVAAEDSARLIRIAGIAAKAGIDGYEVDT